GQAGADVEELTYTALGGQETHRAAQEGPILHRHLADHRQDGQDLIPHLPVDGIIVFSSEPMVVNACRVRFSGLQRVVLSVWHVSPFAHRAHILEERSPEGRRRPARKVTTRSAPQAWFTGQ